MARAGGGAAGRRVPVATGGLLTGMAVLAALAARADLTTLDRGLPATVVDVAVGLAFVAAAALSPVPTRQRLLVGSVGAAWLLASLLPVSSLHQGLLVAVLVCFPSGRPSGRVSWLVLVVAVPLAFGWLPQPAVAGTLVAAGAVGSVTSGGRRGRFPLAAGGGVAVVLATSWAFSRWAPSGFDPRLALLAYEAVLLGTAVGHVLAARAEAAAAVRRVDESLARVVALTESGHLAALEPLLAEAVGDPDLRIRPWDPTRLAFVDHAGRPAAPTTVGRIEVGDDNGPVAAVDARPGLLSDPGTAAAVRTAVRLAATQQRLQAQQQHELGEMQAARRRLIAATDVQREAMAAALRQDVLPALDAALELLPVDASSAAPDQPLQVVRQQLRAASSEVLGLVAGVPPESLGDGRLAAALRGIAQRSPVPVRLDAAADTQAAEAVEATLYYVCSEAVANAIKHADASVIDVTLGRLDDAVVQLVIRDDGRGGADPRGAGLRGLADRVAAADGWLVVDGPPGDGTTVTATVPLSRSGSTA